MKRLAPVLVLAALATLFPAPLDGQVAFPPRLLFVLDESSTLEWGCFDPCACPISIVNPIKGTFVLVGSDVIDPGDPFRHFGVQDVRWRVPTGTQNALVTGTGKYIVSQLLGQQRMELDLSVNGDPPQHYDSGLVPWDGSLDNIRVDVSLHGEFCHDSVYRVRARQRTTDAPEPSPRLTASAAPNPFGNTTDISFALPAAGFARVWVHDLAGREIAMLSDGWRPAGRATVSWDGRAADGRLAPAGIYLVKIASAFGHATLRVARIQ